MYLYTVLKHICQKCIAASKCTKILLLLLFLCILLYLRWNVWSISEIHVLPVKSKVKHMDLVYGKVAQVKNRDEKPRNRPIQQVSNMDFNFKPDKLQPNVIKDSINVLITFTNTKANPQLIPSFQITVSTMLKHCTVPLNIYIIGDTDSQIVAEKILKEELHKVDIQIFKVNIDDIIRDIDNTVNDMKKYFSSSDHAYYAQSLFFVSLVIHKVQAFDLDKAIFIDSDLKFESDIKDLYNQFEHFAENNIIGLAHENQPVYRHLFSSYRSHNPGTRVGGPPPNGLSGFNSGVALLNIKRMQNSSQYNKLIQPEVIQRMTKTYDFKGHLGDQDFFTLLSLEYEDLFYVLPCTWNRQLCVWWRDKGYEDVFDLYFKCNGKINIYHGNCNTPFPNS